MVRIHHVLQRAAELATADKSLIDRLQALQQAKTLIEESVYELREYARGLESQPEELDRLEDRLSALRKLQKKFGSTSDEILTAYQEMKQEYEELSQSDERLQLRADARKARRPADELAKDLHKRRKSAAELLQNGSVNDELTDLNMKGVLFCLRIEWLEERASGQSDVEFMIQSSKKDEPRGLMKAASGGELSRLAAIPEERDRRIRDPTHVFVRRSRYGRERTNGGESRPQTQVDRQGPTSDLCHSPAAGRELR